MEAEGELSDSDSPWLHSDGPADSVCDSTLAGAAGSSV